jgi:hypothetical protein
MELVGRGVFLLSQYAPPSKSVCASSFYIRVLDLHKNCNLFFVLTATKAGATQGSFSQIPLLPPFLPHLEPTSLRMH